MNEYIAKQGDRWDSIYFKHYGEIVQNGYQSGYNAFLLANIALLDIDVFAGGERVILPVFEVEEIATDILPPWGF
ncbi:tail protein X [Helicobacter labacensis]|uniref:tail protein X n=1 Tax=Helicobacter labacensis TaxID=2316079 RepID=UPI000EB1CA15|nr:tail protein X [Helicobacter labacensis]